MSLPPAHAAWSPILAVLMGWWLAAQPVHAVPPAILEQPVPRNVVAGATLSAQVSASGDAPLAVRWFRDGSAIDGATNLVLEIPNAQQTNSAFYHAVITNLQGAVTSKVVSLTVDLPGNALALSPRGSLALPNRGPYAAGVEIRGRYAYVVHGASAQLRVLDVANPDAPVEVAAVGVLDTPFDVALAGDYALVAARGSGVAIVDIRNPLAPQRIKFFRLPGSLANSIQVVGSLAFVGNEDAGLVVLDVRDPLDPVVISTAPVRDRANGVRVEGGRAQVAEWGAGVSRFDPSNPARPVLTGRFPPGGSYRGTAFASISRESALYVADVSLGLVTVNWEVATNAVQTSRWAGESWGVELAGPWLLMADGRTGLRVFSLNDPFQPIPIGRFAAWDGVDTVLVRGNRLFTVGRRFGIIDLETPDLAPAFTTAPQALRSILGARVRLEAGVIGAEPLAYQWFKDGEPLAGATNVVLDLEAVSFSDAGNYLVRASNAFGTNSSLPVPLEVGKVPQLLAWTSPATNTVLRWQQPVALAATASSGLPVNFRVLEGPAQIVDGAVVVTNVGAVTLLAEQPGNADYEAITVVRSLNLPLVLSEQVGSLDTSGSAVGVQVVGSLAYVADGSAGLQVIDVSDPSAPVRLGGFDTSGDARAVEVVGNFAYVADGSAGLQVIDVSDPSAPVRLGGFDTSGDARAVEVVGNLAFVADSSAGLQVIDLTDPSAPVRLGGFDTRGEARGVQVVGNLAYVADGFAGGLQVIDVSIPSAPVRFGGSRTNGRASGVEVAGGFAFVADGISGLQVFDLRYPSAPRRVAGSRGLGGPEVSHSADGIQVKGALAYMADSAGGLQILDVRNPRAPVPVGRFETVAAADVQVVGNLAYVADSAAGLRIIRLQDGRVAQSLAMVLPAGVPRTNSPIALNATSSLGLPVTYRVVSGPASAEGNLLSLTGVGNVVVRAEQAGDEQVEPASEERVLVVTPVGQTLEWTSPATNAVLRWHQPVPLTASASSGLPVSFRVQSGPAFITNGTVVATNAGSITLVAWQSGDETYTAAMQTRSLNLPSYPGERQGEWPGWPRGEASDVFVQGNRAYLALGSGGLAVLDVGSPAAPVRLGGLDTIGGAPGVWVEGTLAFVADGSAGLQVIDVGNPAVPMRMGGFDTSGIAWAVQVVGNRAYVADGSAGLQVIDVSNPSAPVRLGGFDTSGDARAVQVVGNLAFVADGSAGLQVIDVSNPSAPVRLGGFDTSGEARGVQVVGNLAYVADNTAGLQVLDVSNPAALVRLGGFDTSGNAYRVHVVDNLAYVADGSAGLQVIDVGNPAAPVSLGVFDTSDIAFAVQVVTGLAYVADLYAGLQVIDVRKPAVPVRLGGFDTSGTANRVHVVGNRAYVADGLAGLQIIDVANPAAPVHLGALDTSGSARGVQVVGNLAYVADDLAGLQVFDVSNPSTPVGVGGFDTSGNAVGVHLIGNRAYVADGAAGLQIIDVTNPAAPVRLGGLDTSGNAWAVQVVGNLAYVADGNAGLVVVEVSNPAAPVRVGGFDTSGTAMGVQVVGNLAYVADDSAGLQVIDVSNPTVLVRVGGFSTSGSAIGAQVVGNLAYVAVGQAGLQVIDVSNPGAPLQVGGFDTSGTALGVQVEGDVAYVADSNWGLQIIRVRDEGLAQALAFDPPASIYTTQSPITLNAAASSGLPVTFRVVSGPAALDGDRLTPTGVGTVVIRAEQAGNEQFQAARLERAIVVVPPPTPPSLTGAMLEGSDRFRFELTGAAGTRVVVEFSEDLRNWAAVATNTLPGSLEIAIPAATGSGFYRALVQP